MVSPKASRPLANQPSLPKQQAHTTAWYRRASRAALTCTRVQDARHPTYHGAARAPHLYNCSTRPRRKVSPTASRPPAAQPGLPTNNQHTHRMVSQSVPSGTDLHPCARRKTSHRPWCRRSAPSVQLPHSDPDGRCRRSVPTVSNPARSCPRTTCTALHSQQAVVERAGFARRKGVCQSFLLRGTQRQRRSTHRRCEEEGGRAIPLPPMKSRLTQKSPVDLRSGEPASPPQVGRTTNKRSQMSLDMHIESFV